MHQESLLQAIYDAIHHAKGEGLTLMNRLRLGATSAFLIFYLLVIFVIGQRYLANSLLPMLVLWVGAMAIYFLSKRSERFRDLSRFGIAVFDLPMMLVIQSINIQQSPDPVAAAAFSVSICVFLTVLSGMTLDVGVVVATTTVAVICQIPLQTMVGGSPTGMLAHTLIIILAGFFSSHIPRRSVRVVRRAAERQIQRDTLARYFSPGVAESIEARSNIAEGQACEVTVLFLDLRGFTALSESLDSREVIKLLNEFFAVMVGVIFRHGGTLDKYLGDGLMAYFNAPVSQPQHAALAVQAAMEMVDDLHTLNEKRESDGLPPLRIGIGIHTGEAVVGTIGAPNRPEYTAIGDTVNVASRLEALTKEMEVEILVSERTAQKSEPAVLFRPLDEVTIRGKRGAHKVYTPVLSSKANPVEPAKSS